MNSTRILIFPATIFATTCLALASFQVSCSLPIKGSKALSVEKLEDSNPFSEVTTVEFCQLLKDPLLYQSKIIRIRGRLSRFRDYISFYDEKCVPRHPLVKVIFDQPFQNGIKNKTRENLIQIVRGDEEAREGNVNIFVSAVGLFEAVPRSQQFDFTELQYQFTIRSIDSN